MKLFLSFALPVAAVIAIAAGYEKVNNAEYILCRQQYALCTSAPCIPDPEDPTKTICVCDVLEGPSLATVSCDQLKPSTDSNGIRTVYSTFSLEQFRKGKKVMECPNGTPWSSCLNKRCTVDPADPKKAICTCDVYRSEDWVTLGGNCDTSTCKTGYWSGAPTEAFNQGNAFMTKALNLKESPAKWCPIETQ